MRKRSYFDGTLLQQVWMSLTSGLMVVLTLGIATPWAVCRLVRWETSHTVIEGNRLRFVGKPMNLFGQWVKWLLLTIITFGIYGFWVNIKMKQWITKHTVFDETTEVRTNV